MKNVHFDEYCEHCWDFALRVPKRPISNCPRCMLREWPERSISENKGGRKMKTDWRDRLLDLCVWELVAITLGAFLVVCWVYAA